MEQPQVITMLIFIALSLIGIVYWIHRNEIKELKTVSADHEKRIQKQEDVTTIKMDTLIGKVDKLDASNEKLESKINELAHNIHKEKNQEQQLTTIMNLMLKELEKRNEKDI